MVHQALCGRAASCGRQLGPPAQQKDEGKHRLLDSSALAGGKPWPLVNLLGAALPVSQTAAPIRLRFPAAGGTHVTVPSDTAVVMPHPASQACTQVTESGSAR